MDIFNESDNRDDSCLVRITRLEAEVLHSLLAHTCGQLPDRDPTWDMYNTLGNALFPGSAIHPTRYSFKDSIRLDECTLNDTTYYQTGENNGD